MQMKALSLFCTATKDFPLKDISRLLALANPNNCLHSIIGLHKFLFVLDIKETKQNEASSHSLHWTVLHFLEVKNTLINNYLKI